jgi:preprotein translocase subunit Sec61beta
MQQQLQAGGAEEATAAELLRFWESQTSDAYG